MKYVKGILGIVFLVLLDQLTKHWAAVTLRGKEPVVVWKGVFELRYLENRGIAFGLFQNKTIVFVVFTIVILAVLGYYYYRIPAIKKMIPLQVAMVFLGAGAAGNLMDRIIKNYVIDFLYFSLIDFPIFNVADCYVTVSLIGLVCLILFYYKEEDLNFHAK
ncbi:signal peptidase II [[Clostridium] polysaccharolyticum]|uniref:Lipoprotein signal peptidase n=1 Tax=[Clostridium] polysaccharolyticum TaxID=29364 RepID=A0A1I0E201_9FIRM|nr:signal peptidase II [[Clostridium] polysaccharolyticum]SET38742.1 signal peptidase II [[Clostridium] polysaccharolyticum]